MAQTTRRQTIVGAAAAALFSSNRSNAEENHVPANDLIIVNAKVAKVDRQNPAADRETFPETALIGRIHAEPTARRSGFASAPKYSTATQQRRKEHTA